MERCTDTEIMDRIAMCPVLSAVLNVLELYSMSLLSPSPDVCNNVNIWTCACDELNCGYKGLHILYPLYTITPPAAAGKRLGAMLLVPNTVHSACRSKEIHQTKGGFY